MFDRLDDLLIRYEELMEELGSPEVASDTNRFRKLMKEQSDLAPIVEALIRAFASAWTLRHNSYRSPRGT